MKFTLDDANLMEWESYRRIKELCKKNNVAQFINNGKEIVPINFKEWGLHWLIVAIVHEELHCAIAKVCDMDTSYKFDTLCDKDAYRYFLLFTYAEEGSLYPNESQKAKKIRMKLTAQTRKMLGQEREKYGRFSRFP